MRLWLRHKRDQLWWRVFATWDLYVEMCRGRMVIDHYADELPSTSRATPMAVPLAWRCPPTALRLVGWVLCLEVSAPVHRSRHQRAEEAEEWDRRNRD